MLIMIRAFDIFFSVLLLTLLFPLFLVLIVLGTFESGSPFFLQERIGMDKSKFVIIKFRTMYRSTPSLSSTHLIKSDAVTPMGKFLRKYKLDELPQIFNVLIGNMSFVGPRPNLFTQTELINERDQRNIYSVRPGITGLAQINNVDMSNPVEISEIDAEMLKNFSFQLYVKIIILTIFGKGVGDRVRN